MSDVIRDKKAMHRLINNALGKVLGEAPIAPQAPAPQAPVAPPPAPAATQPPPGDGVNQVSVHKAAGAVGQDQDLQKGTITIEMVVEKLNSIRSGRSFKDENIQNQMQQYFNDLNDNERLALYAFLKGIAQIITADIPAQQAPNPQSVELEVKDKGDGMKNVRHVKPNIVKPASPAPVPTAGENTRAPSPIVPKQR